MNGVNFSIDGPMIEGTWQNMQTGDTFIVRDSFFQDGQLMIQATDGRMFDYNTIQNYVKVDKPIPVEKKKSKTETLPAEIANEIEPANEVLDILPEDAELLNGSSKNNWVGSITESLPKSQVITEKVEDEDLKLINRVLTRAKSEPVFEHKVTWKNFPVKQMEMLVDYMGVPVEKICHYYIDKLSNEDIRAILTDSLSQFIEKNLDSEPVEEEKPKKPKK